MSSPSPPLPSHHMRTNHLFYSRVQMRLSGKIVSYINEGTHLTFIVQFVSFDILTMPDRTSSSTKKLQNQKSKARTTTKISPPHYYYHYPPADLSFEERYRSSNTNSTTPPPYQYHNFPHFCKTNRKHSIKC